MNMLKTLLAFAGLVFAAVVLTAPFADSVPVATAQVWFSPKGGCEQAVVSAINESKVSVRMLAYSFTSKAIADALIASHVRGVDVQAVLDRENPDAAASKAKALFVAGVPVYIDSKHAIAHNKVVIIDGKAVLTGSFNFTNQAEHANAENLLRADSCGLAKLYNDNWELHKSHSERMK